MGISMLCSLGLIFALHGATSMEAMRMKLDSLAELSNTLPAQYLAEGIASSNGCTPLFYGGLPYQGKPTRVFAWYAKPAGNGPFPAIVLAHGGGGTAFAAWAAKWRDHGFCAIAMDLEGHLPERDTPTTWKSHSWSGPERVGFYADINQPIEDQWPYHAVADILLAKALLKSFPEVDANKIGVMGFSWGGIHTGTAIGIDTNWLFAIPTYHCGALSMIDMYRNSLGTNVSLYENTYDSLLRLSRVNFPVMWLTALHDPTFPLDAQRACYRAVRGPCLISVQTEMKHGSFHAWNPEDSYAFAQSIVSNGSPWITVKGQGALGSTAYAEYESTKAIDRAEFIYTADTGFTGTRNWQIAPVAPEKIGGTVRVSAAIPEGTTAWYFNVYSGALVASSEYSEPAPGGLPGLSDSYVANRVHAHQEYKIDVAANPARSPRDINGIAALGADHMTHVVDFLDEGAWWTSSVGAIDPLAQTVDIASNQISYVHQAGMKSIGYFRYTSDAYCQSNHPDWQCLDRFGAPFPDVRNTDTSREVNVLCLNSDYREFIKIRLQELADRGIDYIYYDWCHMPEVCTCPACRQKYTDRYGEPFPSVTVKYSADYLKVAKFVSDSMKEAFWYWRESARAINPELRFVISGGKYSQHWGDVHISDDFISMADSPKTEFDKDFGGATVYRNQLVSAIPDFHFPSYDLETSIGWSIIRDACDGRAPAVWAPWMRTEDQALAAAGALLGYGCVMDLNLGAMPSTNIYSSVFNLGKTVSPSMIGASVYPWALVHVGETARNARIADIVRLWNGFFGPTIAAVEALDRERLPYMTITDRQLETGNISTNTKVIILPATNLSAFVSARIAQAESNGVAVIRLSETNAWCRTGTRPALLAGLRATLKDYATNSASRCQISVTGGSDELHVTAYVKPDGKMTVHLIRDWSWLKGRESQTVTPPAGLITDVVVKRTRPDGTVVTNTVPSMGYYRLIELN